MDSRAHSEMIFNVPLETFICSVIADFWIKIGTILEACFKSSGSAFSFLTHVWRIDMPIITLKVDDDVIITLSIVFIT